MPPHRRGPRWGLAVAASFVLAACSDSTGPQAHLSDPQGLSADLQAVTAEIHEQVRLLDGLVRYRFGDNAELMGAWASARNVLGPFRSKSEPPAQPAKEGQTPAGPDAVKSAA